MKATRERVIRVHPLQVTARVKATLARAQQEAMLARVELREQANKMRLFPLRVCSLKYLLLASLLQSCVIDGEDINTTDPISSDSQCGEIESESSLPFDMDGVGLRFGYLRPFEAAVESGTEDSPLDLPMEYGLQGGHHVDLSLRFIGSLNPDLVDITINLQVDDPLSDLFYGQHETRSWYLLFSDEEEPEGCYFHQARIFLFDLEGLPVEPLGVAMLNGLGAQLTISLTSDDLNYEWVARGILRDAVMQ